MLRPYPLSLIPWILTLSQKIPTFGRDQFISESSIMKNIICIFFFLIPTVLSAQEFNFVFEPDSIPVEVEGWNPYCPFAGG